MTPATTMSGSPQAIAFFPHITTVLPPLLSLLHWTMIVNDNSMERNAPIQLSCVLRLESVAQPTPRLERLEDN
jgi:hypothetical protein